MCSACWSENSRASPDISRTVWPHSMIRPWFTSITLPCEERMGRRSLDIFEAQSRWLVGKKTRLGNFKAIQRVRRRFWRARHRVNNLPSASALRLSVGKHGENGGCMQSWSTGRYGNVFGVAFFSSLAMVVRCCLAQRFATDGSSTSARNLWMLWHAPLTVRFKVRTGKQQMS